MTNPSIARSFLLGEVDALEPFDFVAVVPDGQVLQAVEIAREEDGALQVRVPGRVGVAPPLDAEVCEGLRDRGFHVEDSEDATKPWTCGAADGEAAISLLQEILVEVLGEKPDAALDIGHGSHRKQHEARQKLAIARTRIEKIVEEVLGRPAEQDKDEDYVLPLGEVHITVAPRAALNGQIVVRVFAITNVGVKVTPELGLFLARLNFGLMFGRFALDAEHQSIWFDETLLGEKFREEELRFAIEMVSSTADGWDDRLKEMFGGVTHQEVLQSRRVEAEPPTKPGQGLGLYL